MNNIVIIEKKTVYGNEMLYPANDTAELLAKLIKKKTFDKVDIETIKELGFEVRAKQVEL